MEVFGATSQDKPVETFGATTQSKPAETYGNAGAVRPIDGLGFEPDYVDCPYCEMRVQTKVNKLENENTKLWQWVCGLAFVPFCCCCTYPLPKKYQWHYHTQHRCPRCETLLKTVRYNQEQRDASFVPSKWASTYVPAQQPTPQPPMKAG